MKRVAAISALTCITLIFLVFGCGQPQSETTNSEERSKILTPASTPVMVQLSLPKAPSLNERVTLTFTVSSTVDANNTTAEIKFTTARGGIFPAPFPAEAVLIDGPLTWKGDLKAGKPVSLDAEIVFNETGTWAIEASARHVVDNKNSWGDIDVIYLTVGVDRGEFGWPRTPPVVPIQPSPGSVPGVPSSQEEPPIEDLPPPPSVSQNGTIIK